MAQAVKTLQTKYFHFKNIYVSVNIKEVYYLYMMNILIIKIKSRELIYF